ncbi:hypothetical protein D5S17_27455 [Pseudonocardiaceae bacterium YIM PH 21723]|nr:hypothetical protein D5S17_27455 [Pseudonocardiaceae bacterium YIM PH 21723]
MGTLPGMMTMKHRQAIIYGLLGATALSAAGPLGVNLRNIASCNDVNVLSPDRRPGCTQAGEEQSGPLTLDMSRVIYNQQLNVGS